MNRLIPVLLAALFLVIVMILLFMQSFDNNPLAGPPITIRLYVFALCCGVVVLLGLGWCLGVISGEQKAKKKTKALKSKLLEVIEPNIFEQKNEEIEKEARGMLKEIKKTIELLIVWLCKKTGYEETSKKINPNWLRDHPKIVSHANLPSSNTAKQSIPRCKANDKLKQS